MKKNKYLILALMAISGRIYGSNYPIVVPKPPVIEKSAYEDLLRVVDEINRKNGKNTNYLEGGIKELSPKEDGVDIVPIAHLNDTPEMSNKVDGFYNKETFHSAHDIVEKGIDALDEKTKNSLGFVKRIDNKRFYFGNGNVVKDIIFQKKDKFETTAKDIKDKKNLKYEIAGSYKNISEDNTKLDSLGITIDEYKSKVEGKSKTEVAKFLQEKLNEKKPDIKVELKDGELYTKDKKGEEWKVFWDIQGVRVREEVSEDVKYEDKVQTKIYVYKPNSENLGNVIYTNDSSIYVEDKRDSTEKIRIRNNSSYNGKRVEEFTPTNGNWATSIEKYLYDKKRVSEKKMSEDDFKKIWVEPFEKNGKFEELSKKYLDEVTPKRKQLEENEKKTKELGSKLEKIEGTLKTDFKLEDYYKALEGDKINEEYIGKLKTKEEKELVRKYAEIRKEKEEVSNSWYKYYSEVEEVMKKHAFLRDWKTTHKIIWSDVVVADKDIFIEKEAKRIEFRGKGRIEGTVDLGSGFNTVRITEELTGKYGTNITLGPYAKLQNIDIVEVGKGGGSDPSSPSLSGNHSLTLDIDKNVKNEKGHLIQHAFKDSKKDIRFVNASGTTNESKNDFEIEMMVSKLDKNSVINMGRELETQVRNLENTGDEFITSKITMASDSIAHDIIDKKEKDGGNSLVEVVIKDRINGLTDLENQAYKSIKDANRIGSIWETTSSTTKKTVFEGIREDESLKELKMLTDQMTEKNIYKHLNKIAKNELDVYSDLIFEHNLDKNKDFFVNGGYISNRDVEDKFKGNINTAYAIYENRLNEKINVGGIFGVGTSKHQEVKEDSLEVVTTDSSIKGKSLYLGAYGKYNVNKKLDFFSGIGFQYGEYETNRKLKNHYQDLNFKSKTNVNGVNVYSGSTYNYPLPNDMKLKIKGILSYSLILQDEIKEDTNDLALKIESQNYNYLDGELGFNIGKVLYSENTVSELSAGLSGIYGFVGYDNDNMKGKVQGSTSNFTILGKDNQKDAIKLELNYDVKKNFGLTYGIEGNYLTNSDRTNITIGMKIGYTF